DPLGGLLVSALVVQAGWSNTRAALLELADVGLEEGVKEKVRSAVDAHLGFMMGEEDAKKTRVVDVAGVKSGQNYLVDVTLAVDGARTVRELAVVEAWVRDALRVDDAQED